MATETEVSRAIDTLAATLNDQKAGEFDADHVQEIVSGALAGEQKLIAYGSGTSGELREGSVDGPVVVKLMLDRGKWSVERVRSG